MAYVKIGLIGKLDMLRFKNITKVREKAIQAAPATPLPKSYTTNEKAKAHHPARQEVVISEIRPNGSGANTYVLKTPDGSRLALFRAGQYISVAVKIGVSVTCRDYSLCGSPEWAKHGEYHITVKKNENGFVSDYILENWKAGDRVTVSGPLGQFYYEPLRDSGKVIGLAGGAGITPFMAMAYAIRDGQEDFDLTILYGSRTSEGIPYAGELEELAAECSKIHVVHVLSDETKEGYEHGFITADLIRKYAGEDEFSVFMCGPQAMYRFMDEEVLKLGLRRKFIRRELFGAIHKPWELPGYPAEARDGKFRLHVVQYDKEYDIEASANEPILVAIERAGIAAPSRCRSGECGWCRSRLCSGEVFVPEITDGRRAADLDYGYIHPCASFPLSDITLEIPGSRLI